MLLREREASMNHRIGRALVSVHDKRGVVEFCRDLMACRIEILSSGGTARLLEEHGILVRRISEYTRSPEMLGGRVKTLHPAIHGAILAIRSDHTQMDELRRAGFDPIDLVVVNLYPFRDVAGHQGATLAEAVEMIDIGGPSLVRAAAKNFQDVGVVVDPADYAPVAREIRQLGGLSSGTRWRLAVEAFRHTSAYDSAIHEYLARAAPADAERPAAAPRFPERLMLGWIKLQDLRYGENPHQAAAFYRDPEAVGPSVAAAELLQGKPLSFNNILDFDAALSLVAEFEAGACAIIKHGNPCGVALGPDALTAYRRALECDPVSAFGGVIAFNRSVDREAAEAIAESFYEGVIAPAFDPAAREPLGGKKKLRLLATGELSRFERPGLDLRRVTGGLLVQDWDRSGPKVREAKIVTRRAPTEEEWEALEFSWTVVQHVKSNAIVFARADRTVGIGAGQMSRVDSARFGILKARASLQGCSMASDAFFPFRDGLDVAADAGVRAVVQPGGSIRDGEVVAAADERGMAMVFTGQRHFRH
jgi:phosphoribosylaminoimidazolecarboxamide formyltransferase/IMP cyclohydrolase